MTNEKNCKRCPKWEERAGRGISGNSGKKTFFFYEMFPHTNSVVDAIVDFDIAVEDDDNGDGDGDVCMSCRFLMLGSVVPLARFDVNLSSEASPPVSSFS